MREARSTVGEETENFGGNWAGVVLVLQVAAMADALGGGRQRGSSPDAWSALCVVVAVRLEAFDAC